ncbi:MAG TPA: hypothetical protein GX716_04040 [Firmicutes bacterium]|nr:hypothetical protein [Candidatus Fermentithermobacillaceae bacterium]
MKPKNGQKKKATNTGQRELVATQDATTAKRFGVSVRTARRWRETGRGPVKGFSNDDPVFTTGRDGKRYPKMRRHYAERTGVHTLSYKQILSSRSFLRRAETMGQYGIDARDVALLREIADMATEMAARWATVIPEKQEADHA